MIALATFDIAGTTVQENQVVYTALAQSLRGAGADPAPASIARWMGADKREAIAGLLTESGRAVEQAVVESIFANFRAALEQTYTQTPPTSLPGVPQAIEKLRATGVKVVLTTGFDRYVTELVLRSVGWGPDDLDGVFCVDDVSAGRPAPYLIHHAMEATGVRNVAQVLAAGDTVLDLEAGTNAGAGYVVGVLSGAQDRAALERAPHTHILESVAEIPELLGLS